MPNPFDILQQRLKQTQSPPDIIQSSDFPEETSFSLNARMVITAPPGYVLASVDYKNQEFPPMS
jgi:hypothetical protein